jgi:hypothetical protein
MNGTIWSWHSCSSFSFGTECVGFDVPGNRRVGYVVLWSTFSSSSRMCESWEVSSNY